MMSTLFMHVLKQSLHYGPDETQVHCVKRSTAGLSSEFPFPLKTGCGYKSQLALPLVELE